MKQNSHPSEDISRIVHSMSSKLLAFLYVITYRRMHTALSGTERTLARGNNCRKVKQEVCLEKSDFTML